MSQLAKAPTPPTSFGRKIVHFLVGLCTLLTLGSVGLVALTWGAKKVGLQPQGNGHANDGSDFDERWERIESLLQESESKWQDAALAELRNTAPLYAGGGTPVFESCTVLGRTEDGKHLIAEALWFYQGLPASTAPRVSTIALIRDRGQNSPEVVQLGSCPEAPELTASRVQDLARLVPGARWEFGNY